MKIALTERGPHREVSGMPDGLRRAFEPLVKATVLSGGRIRLQPAGNKVGVLHAGGVTVSVEPKVPLAQLMFLLDFGSGSVAWVDDRVEVAERGDIAATVGDVYALLAERAIARGPLCGYQRRTASLPVLRGRLRLADQIAVRRGAALPLEVSYTDFGPDISENRLLKAAAGTLLRLPRLWEPTQARLARITRRLAAVSAPGESAAWRPSRLNAHYADALRLAEVVLRGSAFGPAPGAVPARGFVLDMDVVFETFVCAALGEALRTRVAGAWTSRPRMRLDVAGRFEIRPDFVFRVAGTPVAIADAKYKYKKAFDRPRDDLYQMIAYCTALGVPRAHLVYAANPTTQRLVHEVRRSGVRVVQHALDLDAPPAELLAAVGRLADELAADIPEPIRTIPAGGRP